MKSSENSESTSAKGNLSNYLLGFILSILLTGISFMVVMYGHYTFQATLIVITVSAVLQILVHLTCFLHMGPKAHGDWNFSASVFTLIIIFILVAGSIWIMHNLDSNMMPR